MVSWPKSKKLPRKVMHEDVYSAIVAENRLQYSGSSTVQSVVLRVSVNSVLFNT